MMRVLARRGAGQGALHRGVLLLAVLGAAVGCGGPRSTVQLLPANEVPPISVTESQASGEATATLDGDTLQVEGRFEGLSGTLFGSAGSPPSAAHVHRGAAGEVGAPLFSLQVTPDSDQRGGTFTGSKALSDEERADFLAGRLYVNVHSAAYTGGEIRGQFTP